MKPLLVGEDNPYSGDPRFALWCHPRRAAGGRLCYDILGLKDQVDYVRRFDRVNLCAGRWNRREAIERARQLELMVATGPDPVIVMCGRKVRDAFALGELNDFEVVSSAWCRTGITYVALPHPSGRCRVWNDPTAVGRAREALKGIGAL